MHWCLQFLQLVEAGRGYSLACPISAWKLEKPQIPEFEFQSHFPPTSCVFNWLNVTGTISGYLPRREKIWEHVNLQYLESRSFYRWLHFLAERQKAKCLLYIKQVPVCTIVQQAQHNRARCSTAQYGTSLIISPCKCFSCMPRIPI